MLEYDTFYVRALLLGGLMILVATVEWCVRRERATRFREYGFLVAVGFIGGLLGVAIDQFSVTLSPEYFVLGKALPPEGLRWRVAELGFQAGGVAGIVLGAVLLFASGSSPQFLRRLWALAWVPVGSALAGALGLAALFPVWDPFAYRPPLEDVLTAAQLDSFLMVWGGHIGLYAGGGLGTAVVAVLLRSSRSQE